MNLIATNRLLCNGSARRRRGFTMIEMLVAASLAALMMVTVMGVLATVTKRVKVAREKYDFAPWQLVLKKQLQFEFTHCRSVLVNSDRIIFDGYATVDVESGYALRVPSKVTYRITSGGQRSWLVRREERLGINISDSTRDTLVCFGASRFQSLTKLETDIPPGQLHLRIYFGSETKPMDVVLNRHGGVQ